MFSYHECLKDDRDKSISEEYALLEPCEVLTEDEWLQGGLTSWIDVIEEGEINVVHVDGTQDEEAIINTSKLAEPLHFVTKNSPPFDFVLVWVEKL